MKRLAIVFLCAVGITAFWASAHAAIIFDYRAVGTSTLIRVSGYTSIPIGQAPVSVATTTLYVSYWASNPSGGSVSCNNISSSVGCIDISSGDTSSSPYEDWYEIVPIGLSLTSTAAQNVTGTITQSIISGKYYFLDFGDDATHDSAGYGDGDGTSFNGALYEGGNADICIADDPTSCFDSSSSSILSFASSSPQQYESDDTTVINEGSSTTENTVVFGGMLDSTGGNVLQLQVEVEPAGSNNFTGTPNVTSTWVTPGSEATATITDLADIGYHWQARIAESSTEAITAWQTFGANATSSIDFVVTPLDVAYFNFPASSSLTSYSNGWAYGSNQYSDIVFRLGHPLASGTIGMTNATGYYQMTAQLTNSSYCPSINYFLIEDFTDANYSTPNYPGWLQIDYPLQLGADATGTYANFDFGTANITINASDWYQIEVLCRNTNSPYTSGGAFAISSNGDGIDQGATGSIYPEYSENIIDGIPGFCLADNPTDCGQGYYAQIENASTLNIRDGSSTSGTNILKTLPAGWVIQVVSSTDPSGNPMIAGGIHWFKVIDPTDGVTGWMAASDTSGQYISSYDGGSQSAFEDMASTTQDDEASRATVIQAAVDHYYTNTSSTGSLYSSDDLSDVFSSSSPDTFPEDLIFPIAAQEDGESPAPAFNNEEVTFDYGHGIMQITPTPSSSDIYFLQKILNSNPATQVATSGIGSPGMESDHFGGATQNAVERFQALYGLATSGAVLFNTRAQLNSMLPTSSIPAIPTAFRFERNLQFGMTDNTSSYSEARGIESGVYIPPCGNLQDPSTSTYYQLCYGDNTSTDPKAYAPQPNYGDQTFKWYANTSQSIYSNIKDGLEILKEKYDACYDGSGGRCHPVATTTVLDGETFTYDQKRDILATWGYNGFVTSTGAGYLTAVADNLADINSFFPSISNPSTSTGSWYNKLIVAADNFITFKTLSPVNATIVDSEGRVTGMVNGIPIAEIPDSEYNPDTDTGVVLFPSDTFTFSLKGTANDTYGFIVTSNENSATTTVYQALNIPIKTGAIHTYTIDFNKLRLGEPGVTVKMDDNGDGKIDRTVTNIGTVSFVGPEKFVAPTFPVALPKPKLILPEQKVFQVQPTISTSTPIFTSSTLQIGSSSFASTSSLENFTSTIEIASSTIQTNSSTENNE